MQFQIVKYTKHELLVLSVCLHLFSVGIAGCSFIFTDVRVVKQQKNVFPKM